MRLFSTMIYLSGGYVEGFDEELDKQLKKDLISGYVKEENMDSVFGNFFILTEYGEKVIRIQSNRSNASRIHDRAKINALLNYLGQYDVKDLEMFVSKDELLENLPKDAVPTKYSPDGIAVVDGEKKLYVVKPNICSELTT